MTAIGKIKRLIDAAEPYTPVDEQTVRLWGRSLGLVRGNYRGGRAKPLTEEYKTAIWQMVNDPLRYWSWVEMTATLNAIGDNERVTVYTLKQWARKMGVPPRQFPGQVVRDPVKVSRTGEPEPRPEYAEWDVVRSWAMANKIDARRALSEAEKGAVLAEVNARRVAYGLPRFILRAPAVDLCLVRRKAA